MAKPNDDKPDGEWDDFLADLPEKIRNAGDTTANTLADKTDVEPSKMKKYLKYSNVVVTGVCAAAFLFNPSLTMFLCVLAGVALYFFCDRKA